MNARKNSFASVVALTVLLTIGLACGGGNPAPPAYQGSWVGSDGSTIYMHADGKAGFKVGSKEVTGGGAELDEAAKSLKISLFGISHTWKIDQPPSGNVMVLSGTRYTKN